MIIGQNHMVSKSVETQFAMDKKLEYNLTLIGTPKMQRYSMPSSRGPKFLLDVLGNVRLGWRLLRDSDVPAWSKLIPVGAILYLLFPFDFIPDLVPGLGQVDDLTLILLGLKFFIDSCPRQVVEKHRSQMSAEDASYRVVSEEYAHAAKPSAYLNEHNLVPDRPKHVASGETCGEGDSGQAAQDPLR
jgi:uncharacterized membrane protein YkvA (DUF1232 family)